MLDNEHHLLPQTLLDNERHQLPQTLLNNNKHLRKVKMPETSHKDCFACTLKYGTLTTIR